MKKRNYLLLLLIFNLFISKTYALTIRETSDPNDGYTTMEEGSVVIGVTRFSSDTIVTASKAATAGANDAMLHILQNGTASDYDAPVVYYYVDPYVGWFSIDNSNKVVTVTDSDELEMLSKLDIYYVDNVEKVFEVELNDEDIDDSSLPDGVAYKDNKLFINATIEKVEFRTKDEKKISFLMDLTISKFIKDIRSCYTINNGMIIDYDSECGNNIVIPMEINNEKIIGIGANAFKNANLVSVVIPSGIRSIGNNAFANNKLESVIIKDKYDESEFTLYGDNVFGDFFNIVYDNELSRMLNYLDSDYVIKYYKHFDIDFFKNDLSHHYGILAYIAFSTTKILENNGYNKSYEFCWDKCNYHEQSVNMIENNYGISILEIGNLEYEFIIEKYNKETGSINEVSKIFNLSFVEAGNKRDNDTVLDAIDYLMSVGEGSNLNDDVDVIARIRDFYYLEDEYDIDILFYQLGVTGFDLNSYDIPEIVNFSTFKMMYYLKDGVLYQRHQVELNYAGNFYFPKMDMEDYDSVDDYVLDALELFPEKSGVTNYVVKIQDDGKMYRKESNSYPETKKIYYVDIFDNENSEDWYIYIEEFYDDKYDSNGYTLEECFNISDGVINGYDGTCGVNLVIPNSVNGQKVIGIGSYVFSHLGLKSVILPNSLERIEGSAFSCNSLKEIILPDSLTFLDYSVFLENQIESITFGGGLEEIGSSAFAYNKLKRVVIPSNIKNIRSDAFKHNQIEELIFNEEIESIEENAFAHNNISNLDLPESLKFIGGGAFTGNKLSDNDAFIYGLKYDNETDSYVWDYETITSYGGERIDNIVIPSNVKNIESYSFSKLGITEIEIPYGVERIGHSAFMSNNLSHIMIPTSVTDLRSGAFDDNKFEGDNRFIYTSDENGNEDKTTLALFFTGDYYNLDTLEIPSTVKKIWPNAFSYGSVNKLIIPYGVEEIGDYAFQSINIYGSVTLPKSLIKIGKNIFSDSYQISEEDGYVYAMNEDGSIDKTIIMSYLACVSDGVLNIPDGVVEIKDYAFYNKSSIKEVILPSTLRTIGDYAFYGIYNLEKVTLNEGLETIGDYAFAHTRIREINIPSSVEIVGNNAFYYDSQLSNIILNEGVKKIGNYAFYGSSYVPSVVIPSSVTSIGEYGFGWNINTISVLGKSSLEDFIDITNYSLMANEIIFENINDN